MSQDRGPLSFMTFFDEGPQAGKFFSFGPFIPAMSGRSFWPFFVTGRIADTYYIRVECLH
jgi:hypothetical protein